MNRRYLDGNCHGMMKSPYQYLYRRTEVNDEESIRVCNDPAEVRTKHLSDTSLGRYHYDNLSGTKVNGFSFLTSEQNWQCQ
jgi:hypothetical protein